MPNRTTANPEIHFGRPCVAGTRITVRTVLELVNEGLAFDRIIADYHPDLTDDDLHACLDHAIALIAEEEVTSAITDRWTTR